MFKLRSHLALVVSAGALSVACGADKTGGDSQQQVGPSGFPMCGDDPAAQPAKCEDASGALRCKADSTFPGNELALCPLQPDVGQLIHFGPSDYSDPTEVAKYTLEPNGEDEFCIFKNLTNTELKYLDGYHGRMRPFSHHLIVTEHRDTVPDETTPWHCFPITAVTERWLFASQWPAFDVASVGGGTTRPEPGDPDYGLSREIKPNQTLTLDMHYANASDQVILREAWATLTYEAPGVVPTQLLDVMSWINGGIDVPALAQDVVTPRFTTGIPAANGPQSAVHIGFVTAHAHSRLARLSMYKKDAQGAESLVYESHNWHEPGECYFRDAVQNPPLPVPDGANWGGMSGFLYVQPGDELSFECEFDNTENYALTFGETTAQEMCNVFGFYYPGTGNIWLR